MVFLTQKEDPTRAYHETQILAALRETEGGMTGIDVYRQVGISEQTFYCGSASMRGWASVNCANCGSSVRRMPS